MRPKRDFHEELLASIEDGVYLVDRGRQIEYWNKGAENITGFRPKEVLGSRCWDNLLAHVTEDGTLLCFTKCPLAQTMEDGIPRSADVYLHHKAGHRVPVRIRTAPLRGENGEIVGALEIFKDNSPPPETVRKMEELRELALLDPLTGLGNRRYTEMVLSTRLGELKRYNWTIGVLFLDVDSFKDINDEKGHAFGDEVLKMVSRTLAHSARSVDFVGRWGGEEFVVLLGNVDATSLLALAERFRSLIERSTLQIEGGLLRVTVSIGATLGRRRDTVASVIRRADALMYRGKAGGRNRVIVEGPRRTSPKAVRRGRARKGRTARRSRS